MKIKIKKNQIPKTRSLVSIDAKFRHAGKMKNRREEKGGAKNQFKKFLEDASTDEEPEIKKIAKAGLEVPPELLPNKGDEED